MTSALRYAGAPRRVLLIKPSSLGDVVHAIPAFRALRRKWPEAHFSWLVSPACAGVVAGLAGLDRVMLFDRKRFGDAWRNPSAGLDLFRFHRDLRRASFDLVIDLQGLFRSGWMAWQTGAPTRIGFANAREMAWVFYSHRVDVGPVEQHAVDRYLRVAAVLGCDDSRVEFDFPVREMDRAQVRTMLGESGRYAVLMPGANWATKRWPVERFAELVGPLKERLGLASVVAGGPEAVELGGRIGGALNLAGRTSIPQLVAMLEGAALVIANDSGPMHIAAALRRPLVAIFGPTSPVRTGPYGRSECVVRADVDCSPCYGRQCAVAMRCMEAIDAGRVLEAAEGQVRRGSRKEKGAAGAAAPDAP